MAMAQDGAVVRRATSSVNRGMHAVVVGHGGSVEVVTTALVRVRAHAHCKLVNNRTPAMLSLPLFPRPLLPLPKDLSIPLLQPLLKATNDTVLAHEIK